MHKVCLLRNFAQHSQNQMRYNCGLTQHEVEVHVHLALHDGLHKVHTKLHMDSALNCVELFALQLAQLALSGLSQASSDHLPNFAVQNGQQ